MDGEWVGSEEERIVLAVLALYASEPVAYDTLIEALGGDVEIKAVQRIVRRLENRLARHGIEIVNLRGTGYQLDLSPDAVDALLFQKLCGQGVKLADSGKWKQASRKFSRALDLYRSEPFFRTPSALLELKWLGLLRETQRRAVIYRIRADIHLERHAPAITTLRRLTVEEPSEEIYWILLTIAYYRAGSRPSALKTYNTACVVLPRELDADPGELFENIHTQIKRHDPPLDIPVP